MGKNTSFSLGEHFSNFIDEEEEAKLTTPRAALDEGEAGGPPTPFDFTAFVASKRKRRSKR